MISKATKIISCPLIYIYLRWNTCEDPDFNGILPFCIYSITQYGNNKNVSSRDKVKQNNLNVCKMLC